MNKLFKNMLLALLAMVVVINFSACDDNGGGDDGEGYEELYKDILKNYVDGTIIPTYKGMAEAALEMRKVNEELKTNPSDETMEAAAEAWMAARIWWEKSEAFLFGPVSEDGFDIDGHIDSWPLELSDIHSAIEKENGDITGEEAWGRESGEIGFHTAEYLLFREGKPRPINDLPIEERKYLTAVTDALVWDCILAYIAWAGEDNVSSEMKTVFRQNQDIVDFYNDRPNYHNFGDQMKTGTNNYPSLSAAVEEISEGAKTIAEEVGAVKIESPYVDQLIAEVESWYSWHSLDDYTNNIESIKNAYLGGVNNQTRTTICLSTYVAKVDAKLDKQVKDQIEDCITKIQNMGKGNLSFYEVVKDQKNKAEVEAAVEACLDLRDLFGKVSESIE